MRRPIAKFSETRSEELHREREHLDGVSIVVNLEDIDREHVIKVLDLLDSTLRRNPVTYTIEPPEGFIHAFYGFEKDIWS